MSQLNAFGSSIHGPFWPDSDVDVLVEVDAADDIAGRMLINIWNGLEDLFQRPVDLLTESSLRNPYLHAETERTKMLIYDGSKRQVLELVGQAIRVTAKLDEPPLHIGEPVHTRPVVRRRR